MSFSHEIKEELSRMGIKSSCCAMAELAGIMRICGSLVFSSHGTGVELFLYNSFTVKRVYELLKTHDIKPDISYAMQKKLKYSKKFKITLYPSYQLTEFLHETGLSTKSTPFHSDFNEAIVENTCCASAYLRGQFISRGSLTSPEKQYSLEILYDQEEQALESLKIMNYHFFNCSFRVRSRRKKALVYSKSGKYILNFLNQIGLKILTEQIQGVLRKKKFRNQAIGLVNIETAYMKKTAIASERHIESIDVFEDSPMFNNIDDELKKLINLRKENPDLSLRALSELMGNGISRYRVQYLLKKIEKMVEEYFYSGN